MENKAIIRKLMAEKKAGLSKELRKELDESIYSKIINSDDYKKANNIFIFVSYNNEVDTHKIIKKALSDKKKISVPKVISKKEGMIAVQIKSFNDLQSGAYGILEPNNTESIIQEELIDLCYLPGLAFDNEGGRMGYGGGFYDRFLIKLRKDARKIGICYSFQVVEKVPMDKNDIYIDGIIMD